ncbi:class I SAM-dependent methyltransferase [Halopseudomonas salegens]|uniref:Methyltransferase domain-containing protein n=1 Tax=Halopseudomonas salegens TaxID=1434072 RepID=A0A1H2HVV4_9GAMM|nr:class I SAM-dependent methyltransferase [Halopseudomonas salegens]SDU36022.1 Methyltransferase domain-containing protein [Halopseudomonas salegens]
MPSPTFDLLTLARWVQMPERLTSIESWHRHMPFAFALLQMSKPSVLVELGTHRGDSYCTFCQGVTHQQLPTRCYAVDTWQGDSQAGFYDDAIYQDLSQWHDPRFSRFSSLLRMTFDEALEHFADGSVDLLHIDGLHTYDAVKHDFESWLPKMSPRGVILFHDTNVRWGDFGVWQLWAELAGEYPSFEFPFGFGLGVLAVGSEVPQAVLDFLAYANSNTEKTVDFFYRLGDAAQALKVSAELQKVISQREAVGSQLQELRDHLQAVEQAHAEEVTGLHTVLESRHASQQLVNDLHQQLADQKLANQELQRARQTLHAEASSLSEQALYWKGLSHDVTASRWWRLRSRLLRLFGRQDPYRKARLETEGDFPTPR